MCSDPLTCRLCAIVRTPQRLTSKSLASLARHLPPAPIARTATVDVKPNPELVRQVEAERARNAALKAAAVKYSARTSQVLVGSKGELTVMDPQRTVPTAPRHDAVSLAPAPAPVVHDFSTPLVKGDWAGLSLRVDAGAITEAEAKRIGGEWIRGVPQMQA
jgi:hypothetical protein